MTEGVRTERKDSGLAWLHSIDAARGLAAVMVMLFHAQKLTRGSGGASFWRGEYVDLFGPESVLSSLLYSVFGLGPLGVPLFFVISGFCIHLPFAGGRSRLDYASFARRRWLRLFPAYAVTCIVCFVLLAIRAPYGEHGLTIGNMIGHAFFWHYNLPVRTHGAEVTLVLWTIAIEVHFYILYALLLPWLQRFGIGRATAIALGVGVAYRLYWGLSGIAEEDVLWLFFPSRFALARFGEWLLGAWLAERYVRGGNLFPEWSVFASGSRTIVFGIGFTGVAILGVILAEVPFNALQIPATLGFTIVLGGLIMLERQSSRGCGRAEEDRSGRSRGLRAVTKWLGDRSYSLYLSHYVTLHGVHFVGRNLAGRLGFDFEPMGWTTSAVSIVAICVCLVVAHGLYTLVEAPSHRLARRARTRNVQPR
jgi:peptidoglycan/LPS O-acetylase OafA/YrhL